MYAKVRINFRKSINPRFLRLVDVRFLIIIMCGGEGEWEIENRKENKNQS